VEARKSSSISKSSDKPKLSKWQEEFIGVKSFRDHFNDDLRIACTGISAGKSRALAWWIIMQMVRCNGIRCIGIAQTHKALKRVLIRELQSVCAINGLSYEYNKSEQEFSLENGSVLFGYSGENPEAMLGLSEIDLLAVDEAAYIPEEAYQYASDRMRGGRYEPMSRMISSPQSMTAENWFSSLCKNHPECVIHATAFDNPFTSDRFKQGLKDRYVEGSNIYRQQVLGEIFDFDIASQIVMRSDFIKAKLVNPHRKGYWMGADFAGLGADENTVAVIDETGMVDWAHAPELNTSQKVEQIAGLWRNFNPLSAFGDGTGGYGQGAMDLAETRDMKMKSVNFAQKAFNENDYPNARTEMYLELAKEIKNGFWVCDEVKDEILAMQVEINKKGQQQLLPKELAKKILGHSPDLADAVALAVYAKNHDVAKPNEGYSAEKARSVLDRYYMGL
jgi:hypothetical protein